MEDFRHFAKMSRLNRPVIVTEKIDGTNAQICITPDGILVGSRNRWITPENDNYGFAKWVHANTEEIMKLGEGRHYGEWWGHGIQRNYAQPKKRFSLFNTEKWSDPAVRPTCCDVVPVLARLDSLDIYAIAKVQAKLMKDGSAAAPGFMEPEGVVIYHTHGNLLFKMTPDDEAKGTGQATVA